MKLKNAKIMIIALMVLFVFFFSNDFGIIDIEKTAIITAIAIDYKQDGVYDITAQIAVPEATDTNAENKKAHVSGSGKTIASAIKNIGDLSGWFPNLSFCNLIVLGEELANFNVMNVLDYFSRTLKVQESAIVALAESSAKDVLLTASPFDNISSFAIQKIILKNPGFDNDIADNDIKSFTTGYYSEGKSSYLPVIKIIKSHSDEQGEQSTSPENNSVGQPTTSNSSSGSNGSNTEKQDCLFDVKTTALFKDGIYVGKMQPNQTLTFNMLTQKFKGTSIEVNDVTIGNTSTSYLLTCFRCTPCINLVATDNQITLKVDLSLYCKIADQTKVGADDEYHKNKQLPQEIVERAEQDITQSIKDLIQLERRTECDFLNLKQKLYRYNYKQYSRYKDNFLSVMKVDVNVCVSGQK